MRTYSSFKIRLNFALRTRTVGWWNPIKGNEVRLVYITLLIDNEGCGAQRDKERETKSQEKKIKLGSQGQSRSKKPLKITQNCRQRVCNKCNWEPSV